MLTKRTDAILITGVLLLGIGLILHMVGLFTSYWMSESDGGKRTFGVFGVCVEDLCNAYTFTTKVLQAVQGLTIAGAILAGMALIKTIIFSFIVYKGQTESKLWPVFTSLEALLAALQIFVGSVLFAVDVYSESALGSDLYTQTHLDYSFFLCIVASGLIGFSGILVCIGGHRIIASAVPQSGQVITPGGPPMAVVYQASGSGAVYIPNYQPTESSVMQQNVGSAHPPPHILPQLHSVYPPQQYAAYPPQQYAAYPPQQYAASPTQQFPAAESVAHRLTNHQLQEK